MAKAKSQGEIIYCRGTIQLFPGFLLDHLAETATLETIASSSDGKRNLVQMGISILTGSYSSTNGRSVTLRTYADLPSFATNLGIPLPTITEGDLENPPPVPPLEWQTVRRQKKKGRPLTSGSPFSQVLSDILKLRTGDYVSVCSIFFLSSVNFIFYF